MENRALAVATKRARPHPAPNRMLISLDRSNRLRASRARLRLSAWQIVALQWRTADNKQTTSNSAVRTCPYRRGRGSATNSTGWSTTVIFSRFHLKFYWTGDVSGCRNVAPLRLPVLSSVDKKICCRFSIKSVFKVYLGL
ncbi:hypothetical protein HUJ05_012339 [Dendroctonus ponderosae]|nr:hypothetical protein HUJ05_012339 [Dendroctonus ponderosae]